VVSEVEPEVTLYAIPGSHACECGALMLEHKQIPYKRVDLWPGMHPMSVRLRGFPGKGETRMFGDKPPSRGVAIGDRFGTVPALKLGDERVQTNHAIARRLDEIEPDPPLFPDDPERRRQVEEAERWGDEVFQMAARRLTLAAVVHGPDSLRERGNEGRLGALLWHNERMRLFGTRFMSKRLFDANLDTERGMLDQLPGMLDTIDAWVEAGVLNGERLNAADFLIAPSLALLAYRRDLAPQIEARPAGALVERVFSQR
jgi:glutathione S-transferase